MTFSLFDLMGFQPDTGDELVPVTKQVVEAWKSQQVERSRQEARRAPKPIDPEKYAFFDAISGEPRVWYRVTEKGDYEFYDHAGFDPNTGEALSVITRDVISGWSKHKKDSAALRCYIITRDASQPVQYRDQPGLDQTTGRQCRQVTPEMQERLHEYEKGNRPKRITASDPVFFDLRTGEPVIWYHLGKNGEVEIFDLMGFHPDTGDELLPVTREVADRWRIQKEKKQAELSRRPPQPVDPKKYAPFDPLTGAPRIWFWRSATGAYEFFDNPGFHPRTGEPLKVLDKDAMSNMLKEAEEVWRKNVAKSNNVSSVKRQNERRRKQLNALKRTGRRMTNERLKKNNGSARP